MATEIVYLLGAGASYGERDENALSPWIKRGVPIVNELEKSIRNFVARLSSKGPNFPIDHEQINQHSLSSIITLLNWLAEKCKEFPTIDTYAKLLYITKQEAEYKKLKNALSLFFTLIQVPNKRDLRYDGFIASLIGENLEFPNNLKILSWNYDCQFEFAYGEYLKSVNRYMQKIWGDLNVCSKNTQRILKNDFGLIKLNGTAITIDGHSHSLRDIFYDYSHPLQTIEECCNVFVKSNDSLSNILSFAWDTDEKTEQFFQNVEKQMRSVKTLVIIGYSFPYVNRSIDRKIIQNMYNLQRVYIQDIEPDSIYENFVATLSDERKMNTITYVPRHNLKQFVIPNEL